MSRDYDEAHDPRQFKVVNGVRTEISDARLASAQERIDAYHPQPAELAEQQDGCTESNCRRCLTHPDHRGDIPHAGICSTGKQVGEAERERDLLADAIHKAAVKSGIYRADLEGMTGPQLLMACDDMAECIKAQQIGEVPVTDAGRTVAYNAIDRFLRNNMDDSTYAAYVEHLEALWSAVPAQDINLERARASIQSLLNWIDDWAETPEESGIDAIEAEAEAVLAIIAKCHAATGGSA